MFKAVCFDMDGVLVDTERLGSQVLAEAAALQNCAMTKEQEDSLLGVSLKSTRDRLNGWFPGQIDADRFVDDWCRLMLTHVEQHGVPLKPYANEVLHRLRAMGVKTALCTSNATQVVSRYLRLAGWETIFDHVVTGDMVPAGKPAPDIYLLGAEKLGVAPGECIGVEDSINGIKALRAAGMHSVMIPDVLPYTPDLAPWVDTLLPDLAALERMIEKER